ncbi:MAG: 1-(5-phosphoribosyl)-5-[(5-phosphoribosylamino)methylideneamino]imidazole-4-carboxamide isomerase [Eubacteriales bacterium]|nr:1-(5-phosphoribosyl)-5-[(5-phosphoribosylamino)methylideneamino]imidazole-4-carboxamide isomerase [Eubacteriales bacterium]
MIILPAIDIIDGKPVRLVRGDYNVKTQVGDSVEELAKRFDAMGVSYLHMVDLDGAKAGGGRNRDLVVRTAQSVSMPVQIGGGIRDMAAIEDYIENGVDRVILGTVAVEKPDFLKEAVKRFGRHIAVGVDSLNGQVKTSGWLSDGGKDYLDFARYLDEIGVATIIATDIAQDGTLRGVNLAMMQTLKDNISADLIASGGICSMADIDALAALDIYGAITGKAIYEGTLDLAAALKKEA